MATFIFETCSEKELTNKIPFTAINSWIDLAVRWFLKHFHAPNSSTLQRKCNGEEEEEEEEGRKRQTQSVMLSKQMQSVSMQELFHKLSSVKHY